MSEEVRPEGEEITTAQPKGEVASEGDETVPGSPEAGE